MDVVHTQNGIQRIICAKVSDTLCFIINIIKQMLLLKRILLLKQWHDILIKTHDQLQIICHKGV